MQMCDKQLVDFTEQHPHLRHANSCRPTTVEQEFFGAGYDERAGAEPLRVWPRASATAEKDYAKTRRIGSGWRSRRLARYNRRCNAQACDDGDYEHDSHH